MMPMSPGYLLYYVPLLVVVSAVLAATRFEVPRLIWRTTWYYIIWITVFMAIVALVTQIALWLI